MSRVTAVSIGGMPVTAVTPVVQGPAGTVLDSWRGAWDAATQYKAGDIVRASGSSWIAVAASLGVDPAAGVGAAIGSVVGAPVSFGSPDSIAVGFTVDRAETLYSLDVTQLAGTQGSAKVGIASAVDVPDVPGLVTWMAYGTPAAGTVTLAQPVDLNPGTAYYLAVIGMPGFRITEAATFSHFALTGALGYGTGEVNGTLDGHGYALPVVLHGTVASEQTWEVLVQGQ